MPTVKPWSATYVTVYNIPDANAPRVMEEAGVRQYIWLKRTPTYSMLTGSHFWPALPTAQPQSFISWLPGI
eukprot:3732707-Pyramimonas_sp.AAC.1